jgi:hypothetical protein
MDYFSGLDISMDETHVCVLDREGVVVRESYVDSRRRSNVSNAQIPLKNANFCVDHSSEDRWQPPWKIP